MADPTQYTFSYEEVVEALIRKQGLSEGRWGFYVEFGIQGANGGLNPDQIVPLAIVPVLRIGLQRVEGDAKLPGTVDATALHAKKD
jgi:hypothetical protein